MSSESLVRQDAEAATLAIRAGMKIQVSCAGISSLNGIYVASEDTYAVSDQYRQDQGGRWKFAKDTEAGGVSWGDASTWSSRITWYQSDRDDDEWPSAWYIEGEGFRAAYLAVSRHEDKFPLDNWECYGGFMSIPGRLPLPTIEILSAGDAMDAQVGKHWKPLVLVFLVNLPLVMLFAAGGMGFGGDLPLWACRHPAPCVIWASACAALGLCFAMPVYASFLGLRVGEALASKAKWIENRFYKSEGGTLTETLAMLAKTFSRVGMVLVMVTPASATCGVITNFATWRGHLLSVGTGSQECDSADSASIFGIRDAKCVCKTFGFAPMPLSVLVLKLCMGSFVQDIIFGTKHFAKTMRDPLGISAKALTVYTLTTAALTYIRAAVMVASGRLHGNTWQIYEGFLYSVIYQGAITSVLLLLMKLFVELNAKTDGAPPGLVTFFRPRKEAWSLQDTSSRGTQIRFGIDWLIPTMGYQKVNVFYACLCTLAPIVVCAGITHGLPTLCVCVFIMAFPIWGSGLAIVRFLLTGTVLQQLVDSAIKLGAEAHAQLWSTLSLMLALMMSGMYLRKWLWELQARLRGEPPHGYDGFMASVMTIFLTIPVVAFTQAFTGWAIFAYSGMSQAADIPMTEFNARDVREYGVCLVSPEVSMAVKVLTWMGLA